MPKTKKSTRADEAGVSAAKLNRRVRRFVDSVRSQLQQIAYEWDEVDSSVDAECTAFELYLDEFESGMKERVELLKQPVDNDA